MRSGERLVQVQMQYVKSHVTRTHDSKKRIHVGTAPVSDGQSHFWCHFLPQTPPALPEYGQLPEPERFWM